MKRSALQEKKKSPERSGRVILAWEKRQMPSPWMNIAIPLMSVVLALLLSAIFLAVTGYNPWEIYLVMFDGAFGSAYGLSETVVKAIPLALAGLGVAIAFKMLLWNIGAEGQFYMGAFAASGVALFLPNYLPGPLLLPVMFLAGFAAGAFWGVLPAIPRALWGVNETITTLMLNYVAIFWVDYLVYGPWKDPQGFNFPLTAQFTPQAWLPTLGETRVHLGLLLAVLAAVGLYFILARTKWGYEVRVIGENPTAARYAGMNIVKNVILVMLLSGGLAGLAGMTEVAGITHRLAHGISSNYGYTAIIIAWLSKLNPFAILLVAFLFGGLQVGGYNIQTLGLPSATVSMMQGAILFFVLGSEVLTRYRFYFTRKGEIANER